MTENETELNPPPTEPTPGLGVTREEVRHVAALASLELSADEEERMERDLNAILGYVAELNKLNTAQIAPLSQISEILVSSFRSLPDPPMQPTLRADQPRASLSRQTVLAQAPSTDGVFFKVPKVIER